MDNLKKLMAGVFILAGSSMAMADDGEDRFENYSELLNKQYRESFEALEGVREAELEVEGAGSLIVLEVETEAKKDMTDQVLLDTIDPVVDRVLAQIEEDYDNKVRLIVERDDRIIRSEGI